jgi:hypothetical protein
VLPARSSQIDTNEDLEVPANIEVVMSPQVKEKGKVVLPSHLKDFVVPTWKKGSRKWGIRCLEYTLIIYYYILLGWLTQFVIAAFWWALILYII